MPATIYGVAGVWYQRRRTGLTVHDEVAVQVWCHLQATNTRVASARMLKGTDLLTNVMALAAVGAR